MSSYQKTHTFGKKIISQIISNLEKRLSETNQILKRYPERIPILCQKAEGSSVPKIDKNKQVAITFSMFKKQIYLVPKDLTAYQFSFILRKRLQLPKDQSIWLFVNGKYALKADTLMQAVYERSKDKDGFLYMTYSGQNTYGC